MGFSDAIAFVLDHEGGYVNHPNDPGGETKWGISKKSYPHLDIKALTVEEARSIYHRDYWTKIRGDQVPPPLDLALFDFAVNSGTYRAVRFLRRIVGLGEVPAQVDENALKAIHEEVGRRPLGVQSLAEELVCQRALWLTRLGCTRRGSEVFLVGWMKRIRDNLQYIRRSK